MVTIPRTANIPTVDVGQGEFGTPVVTDRYNVTVKFPRDIQVLVEELPDATRSRFPSTKKDCSIVSLCLGDGQVEVRGFGMPFANPGHPSEGWINRNEPIVGGPNDPSFTLLGILQLRSFIFVVQVPSAIVDRLFNKDVLPPPFGYPYGTQHFWNKERYDEQLIKLKGRQFLPVWSYDSSNAHLAVLTQSQVQDVMWLDKAAAEIRSTKFSAYFVQQARNSNSYYVILPITEEFRERHDAAWRRLTSSDYFRVSLFNDAGKDDPDADWDAKFISYPEGVEELGTEHPVAENELCLLVRRPLPDDTKRGPRFRVLTFADRVSANQALSEGTEH